jgi:hypothetical protein
MPGPEEITGHLEQAGITYCIFGGLASIAYGRPRLTLDADLVVPINPSQVASLIETFPAADFYLPPAEILQALVSLLKAESASSWINRIMFLDRKAVRTSHPRP